MLRGIRTRLLGLVIATVVPFTALIGGGLWNQWRGDQSQAFRSALIEARLLAARVDDQITELDSLLIGLSQAVSARPDDIQANDAALRRAKAELPDYIGNILLSTPDGKNIGTSFEPAASGRTYIGDRDYFRQLLVQRQGVAIGNPVRGRTTGSWVTSVARALKTPDGRLAAVLGVGIQIEHFQEALRVHDLPPGSIVQIVTENGNVILRNDDPAWVGRSPERKRDHRPAVGLERSQRRRALAGPRRTHHRICRHGGRTLDRVGRPAHRICAVQCSHPLGLGNGREPGSRCWSRSDWRPRSRAGSSAHCGSSAKTRPRLQPASSPIAPRSKRRTRSARSPIRSTSWRPRSRSGTASSIWRARRPRPKRTSARDWSKWNGKPRKPSPP